MENFLFIQEPTWGQVYYFSNPVTPLQVQGLDVSNK